MRIGELAALVGVTPRAVRHYHHQGVLPEPARRANGYREYSLRDAVRLARVRRLTALGLGLEEVRDVLADDTGTELRDVLAELDAELARQEARIAERRGRLAEVLRQAEAGALPDGAPLSAELSELFSRAYPAPGGSGGASIAAMDRDVLALIETSAQPGAREGVLAMARVALSDDAAVARTREMYAQLDALTEAEPDDPRVADVARMIAAYVPDEMLGAFAQVPEGESPMARSFADALYADLAPAQAAAIRQAIDLLAARAGNAP